MNKFFMIKFLKSYLFLILCFMFLIPDYVFPEIQNIKNKENKNYTIKASRITVSPKIDGHLDDPCWNFPVTAADFRQREPEENAPATEKTEIRIAYDDRNLYFAIRCYDSAPEKIIANEMRRDNDPSNNDYVEILLDTYNDNRNAFYFATTPTGLLVDGLIRNEGDNINLDWNGIWDCSAATDDKGWTAEIYIPLRMLRFNKSHEQTWGINIGRHIPRKREETFWKPVKREWGISGKYKVSKFGDLNGLTDLKQGGRFEFKPYVYTGAEKEYESGNKDFDSLIKGGVDLKMRISSNIIADLTYNTDFAQVESDQEVVNLTRFDLFFPEKREFFLEGMNIFHFGERPNTFGGDQGASRLFFSRNIGLSDDGEPLPIVGGIKSTGKVGETNYGLLNVLTDASSYYNDDDEYVSIDKTNYSVFRLNHNILNNSSIGAIALNKQPVDGKEYNRAFGIDGKFNIYKELKFTGYLAKTSTPGINNRDWSGAADLYLNSDKWGFVLKYHDVGENFDPQIGFFPRTDIKRTSFNFFYSPRPDILKLRQSWFFTDSNINYDHNNIMLDRQVFFGNFNLFKNGSTLFYGFISNYEYVDEEFEIGDATVKADEYDSFSFISDIATDGSKPLSLNLNSFLGGFYDGNIKSFNLSGNYKPSSKLTFNISYSLNKINLPVENGKFDTNVISSRTVYTFTPKLFAKAYIQYNDNDEEASVNGLFSYIYKPGTTVFLVYNETRGTGIRSFLKDRTIIAKVSYLFNF